MPGWNRTSQRESRIFLEPKQVCGAVIGREAYRVISAGSNLHLGWMPDALRAPALGGGGPGEKVTTLFTRGEGELLQNTN